MLLKFGTSLLKTDNNLLYEPDTNGFIRLTYFNNYTYPIDTPLIGEPYNISSNRFVKNTMIINDIVYPSIKIQGRGYTGKLDTNINYADWSILTFEFFCKLYMTQSWCSPFIPFNGLWPGVWADNYGRDRGAGVTVFRDTTYNWIYKANNLREYEVDNWRMFINSDIKDNIPFHIAYVFKKNNNIVEQKIYINGILQTIINVPITQSSDTRIHCDTNYNSSCYVEATQFAIRKIDPSINNGMNYPVPTEPYAQW